MDNNKGMVAGIIACVLAVLGVFTIGIIFVPLAVIVAILGTVIAVKNKSLPGIGANVLAWILTLVGLYTSPLLLIAIVGVFGINGGLN